MGAGDVRKAQIVHFASCADGPKLVLTSTAVPRHSRRFFKAERPDLKVAIKLCVIVLVRELLGGHLPSIVF